MNNAMEFFYGLIFGAMGALVIVFWSPIEYNRPYFIITESTGTIVGDTPGWKCKFEGIRLLEHSSHKALQPKDTLFLITEEEMEMLRKVR